MNNSILNDVLKEYEKKRLSNTYKLEKRKQELYTSNPELKEIDNKLSEFSINTAKCILQNNSEKYFGLNYKEKDIIEKHMFPVTPYAPKYMESYIVSLVDKGIGLLEFNRKFKCDLKICALSVLIYFIII